jgi:copper chaperone CopZ
MKKIILFILLFITIASLAQNKGVITTTISVKGNCEECKTRIENAADIKGVKLALWSEKTNVLTVTYNSDKVNLEQIKKAIANSGHDTDSIKANQTAYNNLPSCCKYHDKKCDVPKK